MQRTRQEKGIQRKGHSQRHGMQNDQAGPRGWVEEERSRRIKREEEEREMAGESGQEEEGERKLVVQR